MYKDDDKLVYSEVTFKVSVKSLKLSNYKFISYSDG